MGNVHTTSDWKIYTVGQSCKNFHFFVEEVQIYRFFSRIECIFLSIKIQQRKRHMKCTNNPNNYFLRYKLTIGHFKNFPNAFCYTYRGKKTAHGCTDVTGTVGTPPPSISYPSAALNDQGCCLKEHLYSDKITDQ